MSKSSIHIIALPLEIVLHDRYPDPANLAGRTMYQGWPRKCDNLKFTTVKHPLNRRETVTVGNKWVVPYNPYLCEKYKVHINVEICGTIRAITNTSIRAPTVQR
ncbi:hypothetical protein Egran_02132 [Elaphomyces granulatus]|uniref:Uncharacterized protein n=1 Tax=Elaphomyces granulatus TaxID=519963 RepID=A0A232M172_9EURO|nr:hypothetical protein Egran_02132 [Elaphomyces granulatus]